jgi:hypothetical protein
MSSITMSAAVERGMRSASVEFAVGVIEKLFSEGVLKCSLLEAKELFDFDSVAVVSSRSKASKKRESSKTAKKVNKITAKPTVLLPFCGKVVEDWCQGVKLSFGLHTQCTMGRCGEDAYCKTCRKHADNSATGKPPYGDINDRAEFSVDYRDPKGKMTLPYANVVEKRGISMEAAVAAAATMGWTIPAEQLVKRSSKRGRPAKSAAVSDSDSDDETPKKKRGRPSKAKVSEPTQDDQIAQLVAEAYAETTTEAVKVKKVKKLKVKKLTEEQKASAKLAKKEAADKLKAEKKEVADKLKAEKKEASDKLKAEKKEASDKLKAEKKEASDKLKAEKKEASDKLKAEKVAALVAKKEAALELKEEKLVAKALEKEAKEAAAEKVKSEKKAVALKVRQEKAAAKKAEREAAKLRKKEAADKLKAEKAEETEAVFPELEEEAVDSSDDEETELSETMTVGGVEYYFSEQDGQTVLFSKNGEPVGVYDAETDTVQEAEFE